MIVVAVIIIAIILTVVIYVVHYKKKTLSGNHTEHSSSNLECVKTDDTKSKPDETKKMPERTEVTYDPSKDVISM